MKSIFDRILAVAGKGLLLLLGLSMFHGIFPQSLDRDRIVRLEEKQQYQSDRLASIEQLKLDGRVLVIEQVLKDIREATEKHGAMQYGQMSGLMGVGILQILMMRSQRRTQREGGVSNIIESR